MIASWIVYRSRASESALASMAVACCPAAANTFIGTSLVDFGVIMLAPFLQSPPCFGDHSTTNCFDERNISFKQWRRLVATYDQLRWQTNKKNDRRRLVGNAFGTLDLRGEKSGTKTEKGDECNMGRPHASRVASRRCWINLRVIPFAKKDYQVADST